MAASRSAIGRDEPLVQSRSRAAAAMANAGKMESGFELATAFTRAHPNIAARTPPASQNLPRARPRTNRARIRTHAARDAARADLQSLEPNPIGPPKAPHKCPTATPTALHGPAALAGTRATAALASSRSETSRDGAAAAANDAVAKKHTHEARPPASVLGREARASRTTDAGRRAPNVSRDRL